MAPDTAGSNPKKSAKLKQIVVSFIVEHSKTSQDDGERVLKEHAFFRELLTGTGLRSMNFPQRYKADIVSAVESIDLDKIIEIIELFKQARTHGRNIFVCGNTRSASAASRVLCDMVTRSSFERPARFRILALDDRTPEPDADREDVCTERLLVEQLKNFAEPEDVVVGISAPDNSLPILRALEYAAWIGCKTVAFTGLDGGKLAAQANIAIHVGSTHLGTVEDTHVIICHMIGSYFLEFDRR